MTEPKRPPCDACGAEIGAGEKARRISVKGADAVVCFRHSTASAMSLVDARRAKQEPEFYGTMPPAEELPARIPVGSFSMLHGGEHSPVSDAMRDEDCPSYTFTCSCGDSAGCPADQLDWSRIPRQTTATITERANHGLGFDGPRECAACGKPIERFQECSRAALGSDGILRPVPGFFHARCPTIETKKAPDPYAAIRENESAATVNTLAYDLERRRTGKIAALRLDFDRPSGKVKYPESWPERFSGASYEDD